MYAIFHQEYKYKQANSQLSFSYDNQLVIVEQNRLWVISHK
jgi:hypothetical protein